MAIKKILIAGGGFSGLTARYYLSKYTPHSEITLIEKTDCLGGCIQTSRSPFFFEGGPRTFNVSRSEPLLQLIDDLGLSSEVIYSNPKADRRFLWRQGKLRSLTPLLIRALPTLFKEWRAPPFFKKDETIASFATRRFGKKAARTFFDPLALGIFGGDIEKLSISACFPELKAMEMDYGSLTRAFFKKKRKKRAKASLFTLKGGLRVLIDRLIEKGRGPIHLKTALTSLEKKPLLLALPAPATKSLFPNDTTIQAFFDQIEGVSLTVVHIAFKKDLLRKKGFGYLVPTSENDPVLGVVFDSTIFPSQNEIPSETRLTVMLKTGEINTALEALRRHLGILDTPSHVSIKKWEHILPQYGVGHLERVAAFERHLQTHYPHVHCTGNFLRGVSVSQCIERLLKLPLFTGQKLLSEKD